jgi:glutamine amidotransferase
MCRFLSYIGKPILLDRLMCDQPNSIIAQAMAAREAKTVVNADGCGFGWYGERDDPGIYRSILPAWSDANLSGLVRQIRSGLFFAHVRSATAGEVSYANCHPFHHEKFMYMHNGMVTRFPRLRSKIEALIDDEMYEYRRGSTDSEAIFFAALSRGLTERPVEAVTEVLTNITEIQAHLPSKERVRFAASFSDGETLWAFRWASDNKPPTLYHRQIEEGLVVASEPFDEDRDAWRLIPNASVVIADRSGAMEIHSLS